MCTPHRCLVTIVAAAVVATALAATAAGPAQAAVSWHSNKGIVYPSWTYPGAFTTALTGGDWTIGSVTVSCFNSWAGGQLSGTATAFGVAGPAAGAVAVQVAVTPKFASRMPTTVACQADKIVPVAASTMSAGADDGRLQRRHPDPLLRRREQEDDRHAACRGLLSS